MKTKSKPSTKRQIKALRCSKGKSLIQAWVSAYNTNVKSHPNADMSWQDVLFKGYLKYAKHASKCPNCGAFEQMRLARYK